MEDLETGDGDEKVKHVDDHLIDINTDSDHVAANEEDDHSDEQHGNLLVPPLPAGDPAVPARGPPDRLPQHQVHDRDQQERNQKHHHKICCQDVIPRNKQTNQLLCHRHFLSNIFLMF